MNKKLGKYLVLGEIGRGGMAVVYRARQESLDRIVAIKELDLSRSSQDPKALERFQQEARASASLVHPSIITVHDFWERSQKAYIAMEFVEGLELKEALGILGPVGPVTATRIGLSLCHALSYAHEKGIIHRDIKPGNVMLSTQGSVKLADFGIALVSGSADLTTTGQIIGTPSYMSPEQIRGEPLGPASEVFSLGAVLYEMVTGAKPFTGPSDVAVTHAIVHKRPVRIRKLSPKTPRRLVRVIMKCLRKKPLRRYATMDELAEALGSSLPRRVSSTRELVSTLVARAGQQGNDDLTIPLASPDPAPSRGRPIAWIAALVAAIALGVFVWQQDYFKGLIKPPSAPMAAAPVELTINAWPWAEVILDGESLGYTPRVKPFMAQAGRHTLVLKNPHLGERELALDLVFGKSETFSVDLTEGER
ncbi:serine/threonine protein kinase [bacterium]|nr:serine/threonine protein kinase [bacterium]